MALKLYETPSIPLYYQSTTIDKVESFTGKMSKDLQAIMLDVRYIDTDTPLYRSILTHYDYFRSHTPPEYHMNRTYDSQTYCLLVKIAYIRFKLVPRSVDKIDKWLKYYLYLTAPVYHDLSGKSKWISYVRGAISYIYHIL